MCVASGVSITRTISSSTCEGSTPNNRSVTPYRISHPGPGGLIFGYATVNEHAITEGVDILARVIDEL